MDDRGVFCDFVQVTVPVDSWDDMRAGVSPVFDSIGLQLSQDDDGAVLWRDSGTGTVRAKRVGRVVALGASGAVLAGLRMVGLLNRYLAELGSREHRVTRLDLSLDRVEATAPVIERLADAVVSDEGVRLSRKRVQARNCTRYVTRTPAGDTGTIYLGSAQADARLCVYDKRQERLSRDQADCGPLTRYEVRLRCGTGVTLRDAAEPTSAFWHYVAPDVLPLPDGVAPWVPHGSGFHLPAASLPPAAARLLRRVEDSAEARALVNLAREVGPYGFPMLVAALGKLGGVGGDAPYGDALRDSAAVQVDPLASMPGTPASLPC